MICINCPHCKQIIKVYFNKPEASDLTAEGESTTLYETFFFPKTWREFAGWSLMDVEACDPDYIDEMLNNTKPRIGGRLRIALEQVVSLRKNKGLISESSV